MLVNKSLLTLSKNNSKAAIMNMINWSLPSISSLRGSHLIGINLANFIYTVMEKTPDKVLFYDLNACNNYTVDENDLKKIKTSCLIICGELDIMTPLKKSHNLNKLLKNSRLEIIENCGHFHFHEKSSQVRRLISSYIES